LVQGFALADRQTNGFQPVVPLHETQDPAVGENRAIVADDPKVNVHGRRHAGLCRKLQGETAVKLPVFTCPDYQHPTVLVALYRVPMFFGTDFNCVILPMKRDPVSPLMSNSSTPVTQPTASWRETQRNQVNVYRFVHRLPGRVLSRQQLENDAFRSGLFSLQNFIDCCEQFRHRYWLMDKWNRQRRMIISRHHDKGSSKPFQDVLGNINPGRRGEMNIDQAKVRLQRSDTSLRFVKICRETYHLMPASSQNCLEIHLSRGVILNQVDSSHFRLSSPFIVPSTAFSWAEFVGDC
jgi:hypothetical protein